MTPLVVPPGALVLDYADRARTAMFEFMVGASTGWDKRELADWLIGSYQRATIRIGPWLLGTGPSVDAISGARLAGVVQEAVERLHAALTRCMTERTEPPFVHILVDQRIVRPARDSICFGFIAMNSQRLSLADRVLSLLVADYLTRPRDYATEVDATEGLASPVSVVEPIAPVRERDAGRTTDDDGAPGRRPSQMAR